MISLLFNDKEFYNDQDIKNAHSSLDINNSVYSSFIKDWYDTLKLFNLPEKLIDEAVLIMESKRHLIAKSNFKSIKQMKTLN